MPFILVSIKGKNRCPYAQIAWIHPSSIAVDVDAPLALFFRLNLILFITKQKETTIFMKLQNEIKYEKSRYLAYLHLKVGEVCRAYIAHLRVNVLEKRTSNRKPLMSIEASPRGEGCKREKN